MTERWLLIVETPLSVRFANSSPQGEPKPTCGECAACAAARSRGDFKGDY
ncbi:MAG: hypothetical protein K2N83_04850 [Eubacterium sp.]|nr:hypothetical protein [Eubacterium sp.]